MFTHIKNKEYAKPGMKIYWKTSTRVEEGTIQSIDKKTGNFLVIWHTMGDACRGHNASSWPFFRFLDFEEQQYNDFLDKIKDRMDI